jgi:divalent metal cation (Fe/Co/Zn/Cd) transporter
MLRFFSFVKFILVVGFLVIVASFLLLIVGHQNLFNQQEISPKLSEFIITIIIYITNN